MADYTNKLIDFMYVDRPKVASLLAQFLAEGLVTEQSVSQSSESNSKLKASASAKIAGLLGMSVGASGDFEKASADKSSETIKKNPEWAQAKALIQYVSDAQEQNDEDNQVGSLQILSGDLQVYDLTPFSQIADNKDLIAAITSAIMLNPSTFLPSLKAIDKAIDDLNDENLGKSAMKGLPAKRKELKEQRENALEVFKVYLDAAVEGISHVIRHSPFSTVAILSSGQDRYWFSLKRESLLHDHGDTLLKYGYAVDGEWSIACIIDGDADARESDSSDDGDDPGEDDEGVAWAGVTRPIATAVRTVVGRPKHFRSLMPLVVFRSLGEILH